jgi:hypothetical protein
MAGMIHIQTSWNDDTSSPALKCSRNGRAQLRMEKTGNFTEQRFSYRGLKCTPKGIVRRGEYCIRIHPDCLREERTVLMISSQGEPSSCWYSREVKWLLLLFNQASGLSVSEWSSSSCNHHLSSDFHIFWAEVQGMRPW